jgi:type I restriction enzyme S subunit
MGEFATMQLGDVAEVFDGPHATPKTVETGPIFLGIGALQDGAINLSETRHLTSDDFRLWTRRVKPQAGDVVFSYETRLGQAAIIPPGLECCLGRRMGLVRFRGSSVLPQYFLYQYLSPGFQAFLDSKTIRGATVDRISIKEFPSFPISVPSVAKQQRIVSVLDEAFEGIATAKANTEKNLQNARELFGRLSAAVLDQLAPISRIATLEDIAEPGCSLSYGIVQPGEEVAGGLPIVRPVDLNDGVVTLDGLKRIDPALAKSYDRTTLKGNDILLCVRGTTGALALAHSELAGANVTRGIVPIRFDAAQLSQDFGYCLMRSEPVQMQIRAKTYGTALMQINIRDLRQLTLPVPPKQEQEEAVKRFDELKATTDQLVATYENKLAALDELKKSLLHQAFTGQLTATRAC